MKKIKKCIIKLKKHILILYYSIANDGWLVIIDDFLYYTDFIF